MEHRLSALLQLHLHSHLNTCLSGLDKSNCLTRRETLTFWDLVLLILFETHFVDCYFQMFSLKYQLDNGSDNGLMPFDSKWSNGDAALFNHVTTHYHKELISIDKQGPRMHSDWYHLIDTDIDTCVITHPGLWNIIVLVALTTICCTHRFHSHVNDLIIISQNK